MIVDCHTHMGTGEGDFDASQHLEAGEPVDCCFVLADREGDSEQANKRLSEYVGQHKDKMVGFAVVEPTKDAVGVKSVKAIKEKLGLDGLVVYCAGSAFHPAHSRAMRLYESAQELSLPVFFHNFCSQVPGAVLDYAKPYLLDEIARGFPELKMVVGNMGFPFVEQTLSLVGKHENVYADLTILPSRIWQVYNIVVAAHERRVMDKLLFGSGFPTSRASECMETLLGFNKLLGDTNLPTVPRGSIRGIIERDTLAVLGIKQQIAQNAANS